MDLLRIEIQVDPLEQELLVLTDSWCLSVQGTKATIDCTVRKSRKRAFVQTEENTRGGGQFSVKTDKSKWAKLFFFLG